MGPDNFGNFIERTWTRVPSAVVLESINKMLDEAKSKESHSHLSMASDKGSINLNSTYELRLFQLLPVLEELDKDKPRLYFATMPKPRRDSRNIPRACSLWPRRETFTPMGSQMKIRPSQRKL